MTSHGERAVRAGRILEGVIRSTLEGDRAHRFVVIPTSEFLLAKQHGEHLPDRILVKDFPYDTIYRTRGKTEFLLCADEISATAAFPAQRDFVCRIGCKYQATSGSVDEKFPYLYLSCVEAIPEKNIIILMEAKGARAEAVRWLTTAVREQRYDSTKSKRIVLMSIAEFMAWANDAFGAYDRGVRATRVPIPGPAATIEPNR
jgi:hypothetical protein